MHIKYLFMHKFDSKFSFYLSYTKRLAEILCQDEFNACNLPICIVRPSIVTPAFWEPVIGWVDSMNGPPGIGKLFNL